VTATYRFEEVHQLWFLRLIISKDEEQPQVAAGEPVQEEPDQDIPLDFDLTEAGFRGLPPGVDAGEKEWEEVHIGSLAVDSQPFLQAPWGINPCVVIPADAEGAPIAGTVEQVASHWRLGFVDDVAVERTADEPVESWAAEAEAKRWRGDMGHILRSCNICGARTLACDPICSECGPLFMAFWGASENGAEAALSGWNHFLREHPAWHQQFKDRH
jgi:hypothetical protein